MLRLMACLLLSIFAIGHSVSGARDGDDFDYYVLSLSWSPSWCALEGDRRKSPQCDDGKDFGFTLHGLWPQYEKGWPSFCPTPHRNPSRRLTAEMADIMGTSGLAWHQWDKHGRCSGLSAAEYFAVSRTAYDRVTRPEIFRRLLKPVDMKAGVVEEAFLAANPDLTPDMITVTCQRSHFQEVRICLTRELEPRECGLDVRRDCSRVVNFPPIR